MKGVCILLQFAWCCACIIVQEKVPLACNAKWDTSSSSMYNIAFQWTQHNELEHWRFEELDASCVQVHYDTHIRIRKMFDSWLPAKMLATTVSKQACVQQDVLQETVLVSDIILIESLSIRVHATINNKKRVLELLAETDLSVPWFLKMIEPTIISQLEDSLREYHALLALELCKGH